MKGNVVTIVTNIGSPPQNTSMYAYTPWPSSFSSHDILTCKQVAVGSNGSVEVEYTKGGTPTVLVPDDILEGSGLCGATEEAPASNLSNGGRGRVKVPIVATFLWVLVLLIM